ncbi:MAG TPA: GNAT family N-acetyltransferase [Gaiellaceae bacterium]|nr:GNAT family N-acetyltransferase [Gaiellaceae bacterium]
MRNPPYRIETGRLVLRCYDPRDAPLLKEAVDSSLDHLRPWMSWAQHEPQPLGQKVELLRAFRGRFDLGMDFVYGVFEPDESRQLGGAGFHPRGGEGSLEIGYWIRADAIGHGPRQGGDRGADTRRLREVRPRPRRHPGRLGERAEPANSAQARLRRGRRAAPATGTFEPGGERRDSTMFAMVAEEFGTSPSVRYSDRAYDVVGTEL